MLHTGRLLNALAIFAYALFARRVSGWVITPPMVFLGFGALLSETGLLHVEDARQLLHTLAEATLVIVLFSGAAAIDLRALLHGMTAAPAARWIGRRPERGTG